MKRKHKDAMIAMGIKIAGHENLMHDQYVKINDAKQEIINIQRTLKLHGEAHMAQDLLPQFTELVKKVEKLEGVLNFKLNDGPIMNHSKRIADLEETAEALSETVDQLSTCKCQAGEQMLKRISNLETRMDAVTKGDLVIFAEHIDNLNESNRVFLKTIPEVEILKTQVAGLETAHNCQVTTNDEIFDKMAGLDGRIVFEGKANHYQSVHIDDLKIAVDVLQRQMNITTVHYNGLIEEFLKQKRFLNEVEKIMDRERDRRIKRSPDYKKEVEALKQDAKVKKAQ